MKKILDSNMWLSRVEGKKVHGWQFRIERKEITERKFFRDSKYGSNDLALEAAKIYRNEFLEAALELNISFGSSGVANRRARSVLPKNNTSGILGVNRTTLKERNGRKTPYWQTTYVLFSGEIKTKKFSISKYGEQGALYRAIEARKKGMESLLDNETDRLAKDDLETLILDYEELQEYISSLCSEAEIFYFLSTINDENTLNTTKKEFLDSRIGQQRFRNNVLKHWGNKCVVTGSSMLLVAGHIKPWHASSDEERLDLYNGLALSPVYDKAFDEGYISFEDSGQIIIAAELSDDAKLLGISPADKIQDLNFLNHRYLQYHRKYIFKKNHRTGKP